MDNPKIPDKLQVTVYRGRLPRGAYGDVRHVFNRSPNRLVARMDNCEIPLEPGWNLIPSIVVPYAVRQNPIAGTMQLSGGVQSFIAVDLISPPEDFALVIPSGSSDLFDRTPETGKPLDPKRHEHVAVTRSNLVDGMLSRSNLARDADRVVSDGFD